MGYIKQLSEDLIKKIAAGEVIERPASVIKELVENSIDAGATKIQVEIERGGKYIKVSDNGMGIEPDDINLLFARHATSKIRSFDELWDIHTLGFRGEALSSISAVSKVTCRSKHVNQEYGFEIKLQDEKINKRTSAISIGTVFEIDDLFYNVPARQKFLKSESTEYGHIFDILIPLALSHPKISFTLTSNKNVALKSSGSNDLQQVIEELLGSDLKNKLIPVSGKNDFLDFKGFVSALEVYRPDRKSVFIFINNRPVKCQIISKAIFSAFEGLLPKGKYPVVILNLNFKSKFVDINVHPSKKEVRYTQPNDVYNLIFHLVQDAITKYYKEQYKEKSIYSLDPALKSEKTIDNGGKTSSSTSAATASYSQAAFELYTPIESFTDEKIEDIDIKPLVQILSSSNLKCKIIYSNKPFANMTKIGNKTIFEVGMIYEDDLQVVFSGEIVGEPNYQKDFFNYLSNLSSIIFKTYSENQTVLQKKIVNKDLEQEDVKEPSRKKPPETLLYKVWDRDNWTCVYCGKQLLDPKIVKRTIPETENAFKTYINEKGESITNHVLREYIATYDHYLPVSKLPQFNFEEGNLFASCMECNKKKLDSMDIQTWKPVRKNSWNQTLEVAGLCFSGPDKVKLETKRTK